MGCSKPLLLNVGTWEPYLELIVSLAANGCRIIVNQNRTFLSAIYRQMSFMCKMASLVVLSSLGAVSFRLPAGMPESSLVILLGSGCQRHNVAFN